ncbi:MAG TPA: hypothetical protein VFA66_02445 [Gaiellaceae bacterium]|nr:hypothetical protein [Gaiellaceae bacterium]
MRRTAPLAGSTSSSARSVASATHSRPLPNAIPETSAPPSAIVCVTVSVVGSTRRIVPPTVLATQIAPPPLATLAG